MLDSERSSPYERAPSAAKGPWDTCSSLAPIGPTVTTVSGDGCLQMRLARGSPVLALGFNDVSPVIVHDNRSLYYVASAVAAVATPWLDPVPPTEPEVAPTASRDPAYSRKLNASGTELNDALYSAIRSRACWSLACGRLRGDSPKGYYRLHRRPSATGCLPTNSTLADAVGMTTSARSTESNDCTRIEPVLAGIARLTRPSGPPPSKAMRSRRLPSRILALPAPDGLSVS